MIIPCRHSACLLFACLLGWAHPLAVQAEEEKATGETRKPALEESRDGKPTRSQLEARARRAGVATFVWLDVLRRENLTVEQKERITPLVRAWFKSVDAWEAGNGKVLAEATREARKLRAESTELPATLRTRISELRKLRPTPWAMQEKVWNLLSESQQQAFRFNLDEAKRYGFVSPYGPAQDQSPKTSKRPARKATPKPKDEKSTTAAPSPAPKDGKAKAPGRKPWSFID